jgi:hypothetical protein
MHSAVHPARNASGHPALPAKVDELIISSRSARNSLTVEDDRGRSKIGERKAGH